jgi:dTDP-glucose 4,6-dehydratase/UDP-glucose 4-epimerase
MNILIVGSKGFIGSHCVDYFSENNDVWGCDIVMDFDNPRYLPIDSAVSDFTDIFLNHKFDICINCSGAASVPFSLEKPMNDFHLNTLNVFKLLDCIRLYNSECKFITMSSAAVYGNPNELPIKETYKLDPVSPYGYHKVNSEALCEEFTRFWGIKTCCLRIFSAYGPRLKKQLFWDLYHKIVVNDTITLFGTGYESRDFIYISDIIKIIELAIFKSDFKAQKINVANGKQITISKVAQAFINQINKNKHLEFNKEVRKGDPLHWEADISIIKNWGYRENVDLETGIKYYIQWIEKNK